MGYSWELKYVGWDFHIGVFKAMGKGDSGGRRIESGS